jgi:hypothetical protein
MNDKKEMFTEKDIYLLIDELCEEVKNNRKRIIELERELNIGNIADRMTNEEIMDEVLMRGEVERR